MTSMVALGATSSCAARPEASSGAKADARRDETSLVGHVVVMLSGKRDGSSITKTSDSSRRPKWTALCWSSFRRMSPNPSAFPVVSRSS